MINSLFKDSHIPQTLCRPYFQSSPQNQNRQQDIRLNTTLSKRVNNSIEKPVKQVSFGGFFNPAQDSGILNKLKNLKPIKAIREFDIYKSPRFKKWLEDADSNPLLFEATFALGLTCFLRPGAIIALPSDKKNKGDNIYAASHSITSGIVSYLITLVVTSPISKAFDKIAEQVKEQIPSKQSELELAAGLRTQEASGSIGAIKPAKPKAQILDDNSYLRNLTIKNVMDDNDSNLLKKIVIKTRNSDAASIFIKKLPEIFIALPRAVMTIALIPVVLKYVFGVKKNNPKPDSKMIPVSDNYAAINQNNINIKNGSEKSLSNISGGVK